MRTFRSVSTLAVIASLLAPHDSPAQASQTGQMGGYSGYSGYSTPTTDTSNAALPTILQRARASVAMAHYAPGAAPSIDAMRKAATAADDATEALEAAMADYRAGAYDLADSASARAIRLSQMALAADLERHPGIVEAFDAGDVTAPPRVTTPVPVVTASATASPLRLPTSYAEGYQLPFGATAAGPYPPRMRDSLPFGAIPVHPLPSPGENVTIP